MNDVIIAGPGGNYTAFVFDPVADRTAADQELRTRYPAVEQTCFVTRGDTWRGEMAGGEFCGAAALGLAFLIARETQQNAVKFEFSGCDNLIRAEVKNNSVTAEFFTLSSNVCRKLKEDLYLVELPGISHFVLLGNAVSPRTKLQQLIIQYQLQEMPAVGLMITNPETQQIDPWVWVNEIDTLINETACITGSIAAALVLSNGAQEISIRQPCGTDARIILSPNAGKTIVSVSSFFNLLDPIDAVAA